MHCWDAQILRIAVHVRVVMLHRYVTAFRAHVLRGLFTVSFTFPSVVVMLWSLIYFIIFFILTVFHTFNLILDFLLVLILTHIYFL